MSSTATRAWYWAIGVNGRTPVTSPAAHTPASDLRPRPLVAGAPAAIVLDPHACQVEQIDVGSAARGEEELGGADLFVAHGCDDVAVLPADTGDRHPGADLGSLLLECGVRLVGRGRSG